MDDRKYFVIDTNVFIAANDGAKHLSDRDVDKCKLFVSALFFGAVISLDLQGEILSEYFKYMNLSGQPGLSDRFFKYLWDHHYNKAFCELVDVEKNEKGIYLHLSGRNDLLAFDPSELKFIAVYLGSKNPVRICNASDSDWNNCKEILQKNNIDVYEILAETSP